MGRRIGKENIFIKMVGETLRKNIFESINKFKNSFISFMPSSMDFFKIMAILACIYCVIDIFSVRLSSPAFSPDSWCYYELSKNFFNDFYKINTFINYQFNDVPYGTSFPPLYPLVIYVFNKVFNLEIYSGYLANFFICFLTMFILSKISKRIFGNIFWGLFVFITLLYNQNYIDELISARSIPLSICLFFIMFYLIIKNDEFGNSSLILLGLIAGLMVMNRFDYMLAAVMMGFIISFINSKRKIKSFFIYFFALFIVILPWILYSYNHFEKIFVSDNSRTVILAFNNYVLDYFPDDTILSTIFNSPKQWLLNMVERIKGPIASLVNTIFYDSFIIHLLLMIVAFEAFFFPNMPVVVHKVRRESNDTFRKALLILIPLMVQVLSVFLTGYTDSRYFIILLTYLTIIAILKLSSLIGDLGESKEKLIKIILGILTITIALNISIYKPKYKEQGVAISYNYHLNQSNLKPIEYENIVNTIKRDTTKPRVMVSLYEDPINLSKFGALTGVTTFAGPSNLSSKNINEIVRKYKITHYISSNPKWTEILQKEFKVTKKEEIQIPVYYIQEYQPKKFKEE